MASAGETARPGHRVLTFAERRSEVTSLGLERQVVDRETYRRAVDCFRAAGIALPSSVVPGFPNTCRTCSVSRTSRRTSAPDRDRLTDPPASLEDVKRQEG